MPLSSASQVRFRVVNAIVQLNESPMLVNNWTYFIIEAENRKFTENDHP